MAIIRLHNNNPTETEIKMFSYLNLYRIENNDDIVRYAPIRFIEANYSEFPLRLEIEEEDIEYQEVIIFDKTSKTVNFTSSHNYDMDGIIFIINRMHELGCTYSLMSCPPDPLPEREYIIQMLCSVPKELLQHKIKKSVGLPEWLTSINVSTVKEALKVYDEPKYVKFRKKEKEL
ncbi:MAG: hypothetical protein IJX57_02485 [Clostridia bacterium]|nr:hypothetical protein [Clostridia bacterium]